MPAKKKVPQKRGRRPPAGRVKRKAGGRRGAPALRRQLDDLREQIDLVLPEVTARLAAIEHLLREKQLVSRADLVSARAFVRLQEA